MFMLRCPIVLIFCVCLDTAIGCCQSESAADAVSQAETEDAIRFRTADLLPADIITGPNYELDPVTRLQDGRFVFLIRTPWGQLSAHGRAMLELRLNEMHAIERAMKLSRDPHLVRGFLGTLEDSRRGAAVILTDPIGSVLRVPQGLGATLNDHVHPQNRRSGNETRRRLAVELDCDPETSNPILAALLDWIAARKGAGSLAGKAGLSLMVPGLALVPASAQFREQLATRQPSEINAQIERELILAGYAPDMSRTLCRQSQYTTLQRLQILSQLTPLKSLSQHDVLLRRVVSARTPSDGVTTLRELVVVNQLHESSPIEAIIDGRFLTAVTRDRSRRIVCADDYLLLTKSLADFTETHVAMFGGQPTEWAGDAGISVAAGTILASAGIRRRSATVERSPKSGIIDSSSGAAPTR